MSQAVNSQEEFSKAFRRAFAFLEQRSAADGAGMVRFYQSCVVIPGVYVCGYWGVFCHFAVGWEAHEAAFMCRLEPVSRNGMPAAVHHLGAVKFEWVLDAVSPTWRERLEVVNKTDVLQIMDTYASAARASTKAIFLPQHRRGNGNDFEDYVWWPQVKPRLDAFWSDLAERQSR